MNEAAGSSEFRERARLEANRYGPDPWVFVRELLQNARDAGATKVEFRVEESDGQTRIVCTDDGEGMSYAHARRYLFSLYASSKEQSDNQVGRFGVGFWSVLRFDPSRIVIRSNPKDDEPWEIALDGSLEHAERSTPDLAPGTQVVLEKAHSDGAQVRRVRDAATQNARFLCRRDGPDVPLRITINGEAINAPFSLRAPAASFRKGAVRGVVGLGAAPRVELFSRGLRVRSAACLDDLLSSSGHTSHSRVRFPELPGALAPQALLESDGLELLLSRSDARENRSLRKLVKLARLELERLVDRQLAQVHPPGVWERIMGWRRRMFGDSLVPRVTLAVVGGIAVAVVSARLLWGSSDRGLVDDPHPPPAVLGAPPVESSGSPEGYADLAARYQGPRVSELDPTANVEPVPLTYAPAAARPFLAALVVADLDGEAAPLATGAGGERRPYSGSDCANDCLDVELPLHASAGLVRIPVPTGHRLDVGSVRLDGRPASVFSTTNDEPTLVLEGAHDGILRYRTGPSAAPNGPVPRVRGLPDDLRREARRLRRLPLDERVAVLLELVRARVQYSTSREVAALHHQAILEEQPFIERTLAIGAGDCDVQNGLLVALLQAADVPARLAVGYVGQDGKVAPWLHAWAEYRDEDDRWHVADASSSPVADPIPDDPGPVAADPSPEIAVINPDPSVSETVIPDRAVGDAPAVSSLEAIGRATDPPADAPRPLGWLGALIVLVCGLAAAAIVTLALRGRTRRSFELDEDGDLSKLLHGALQRPAAFRHLPALFHRKLIPLAGGRTLSLNRARELAADGRLFRSRGRGDLAARAVRRRVDVLDDGKPEARTVGDTLGATDLDRWSSRLDRARSLPVLDQLNRYLSELGERWEVMAVESPGEGIASLDLRALRLDGATRRVVLINDRDPWLVEAEDRLAHRPQMATLLLLDHLLERLDLSPDRRALLLARQARAALREAGA